MGWLSGLGISPFWLRVIGVLGVMLALMAAGAYLMHNYDEAHYQKARADAAVAAKKAQDKAVTDAIDTAKSDAVRAAKVAEQAHRQQLAETANKLAVAQNIINNRQAYSCKLDDAGFAAELEAYREN